VPENSSFTDFSYKESDLTKHYIVEERGVLKLMYEYEYMHYIVRVDGLSGEVEIVSQASFGGGSTLFRDTCRQSGSGPRSCPW
jgi:hypothetical protein